MTTKIRNAIAIAIEYARAVWAELNFAREFAELEYEAVAHDGPPLAKCTAAMTDDVCGSHRVALVCTCQSPLAHPVLWRDPGCPVHSRGVLAH
jgi:hypothetical protein